MWHIKIEGIKYEFYTFLQNLTSIWLKLYRELLEFIREAHVRIRIKNNNFFN